jgi:hypothetical protein
MNRSYRRVGKQQRTSSRTLRLSLSLGEARAREIMDYLGDMDLEATKKALTRYYWQGLLNRQRGLYRMSDRGYERLEYLQDIMQ